MGIAVYFFDGDVDFSVGTFIDVGEGAFTDGMGFVLIITDLNHAVIIFTVESK